MINFGWVFIYVSIFGISDFFVKKYIKTDSMYIFYYFFIGCLGLYIFEKFKYVNSKRANYINF